MVVMPFVAMVQLCVLLLIVCFHRSSFALFHFSSIPKQTNNSKLSLYILVVQMNKNHFMKNLSSHFFLGGCKKKMWNVFGYCNLPSNTNYMKGSQRFINIFSHVFISEEDRRWKRRHIFIELDFLKKSVNDIYKANYNVTFPTFPALQTPNIIFCGCCEKRWR